MTKELISKYREKILEDMVDLDEEMRLKEEEKQREKDEKKKTREAEKAKVRETKRLLQEEKKKEKQKNINDKDISKVAAKYTVFFCLKS